VAYSDRSSSGIDADTLPGRPSATWSAASSPMPTGPSGHSEEEEGPGRRHHRPDDRHRHQQVGPHPRREEADQAREASPEIKAFFARMMRPRDV
jgi:hypothetical protein